MRSRRSFLASAAAGVGALATAGCAGRLSEPGGDAPGYAARLYDPAKVADVPNRLFVSHDLATLYDRRDLFPEEVTEGIGEADDATEAASVPDLERVTGFGYWRETEPEAGPMGLTGGGSVLLRGSFQPETLVEALRDETDEDTALEAAGSAAGHDLYRLVDGNERSSVALGVSEETVVVGGTARVDATGEDATRAMLSSENGGYYRESDVASRLIDEMGTATAVFGAEIDAERYAPDSFEAVPGREAIEAVVTGLQGVGSAMTLGEETVSRDVVGAYAEGETPGRSDVRTLLDLARQGVASRAGSDVDVEKLQALIDDIEVEIDEDARTVVAGVSRETDALFDDEDVTPVGLPGGPEVALLLVPGVVLVGTFGLGFDGGGGRGDSGGPIPQVAFDFEYDADAGEMTVTHTGGDTLERANTERLVVRSGSRPPIPWELPVSAGDSVTVAAESGDSVSVVWTAPDGDRTAVLGEGMVP
jgi:hypothetical protein